MIRFQEIYIKFPKKKKVNFKYLHQQRGWNRGRQCWGSSGSKPPSRGSKWTPARGRHQRIFRRISGQHRTHSHTDRSLCIQPISPPPPPMSYTCNQRSPLRSCSSRARISSPMMQSQRSRDSQANSHRSPPLYIQMKINHTF